MFKAWNAGSPDDNATVAQRADRVSIRRCNRCFITRHALARRFIRCAVCIRKHCQLLLGSVELEPPRERRHVSASAYHPTQHHHCCDCWVAHTRHHHGHLELSRWVIQTVVGHLANLWKFFDSTSDVSSASERFFTVSFCDLPPRAWRLPPGTISALHFTELRKNWPLYWLQFSPGIQGDYVRKLFSMVRFSESKSC